MIESTKYSCRKKKKRYIAYRICKKQTQYNKIKKCEQCRNQFIIKNRIYINNNDGENET